jgi:hypothetical protein
MKKEIDFGLLAKLAFQGTSDEAKIRIFERGEVVIPLTWDFNEDVKVEAKFRFSVEKDDGVFHEYPTLPIMCMGRSFGRIVANKEILDIIDARQSNR